MSIVQKSIDHPVTVVMICILICGIAIIFASQLAIALNPETQMPVLSVNTNYEGAGPEDVEENVTKVLENALSSAKGLERISSTSSFGSSNIRLEFGYGVDLDKAQRELESTVSNIQGRLPDGASTPRVRRFDMAAMPIMSLSLTGDQPLDELRQIGEQIIQPRLERVKGVASADVSGGTSTYLSVDVSPNRLAAYGLAISDVISALGSQNILISSGIMQRGPTEYQVRTQEKLSSIEEVRSVIVKNISPKRDGLAKAVRLEDVADVRLAQNPSSRVITIDDKRAINIQISRESDSNAVQISKDIHTALKDLNGDLPKGATLQVMSDDTTLIKSTLEEVLASAWQGILLAVLVLLFYLRNLKATFIIAAAIPISILITMLAMHFGGFTLNTISMTGLIMALGMVVDASIVILDNIHHYRERGTKPRTAAILGSQEVVTAIMASTLTTLCVFIPIILFQDRLGMMGQLFKDLVFTVCFALAASLIVAMTLVPVLAGPVLKLDTRLQKPLNNPLAKRIDEALERFFTAQERLYKKALTFCLHNRFLIISLILVILVSSLLQLNSFGLNLFPRSEADDRITVNITMPLGTPLDTTRKVIDSLNAYVKKNIRGYSHLIVSVGGNNNSRGSIQIMLPDPDHQIDTPTSIKAKITPYLQNQPGVSFSFSAGRGFSSRSAVDVELRSKNQQASLDAAQDIQRLLSSYLPELENIAISLEKGSPELLVSIDRQKAAMYGFSVAKAAREIRSAIYGSTATTFDNNGNEIDVVVRLREEDRRTLSDLESIFLFNSAGERVPVSSFATISNSIAPQQINRENKERIIHVTANLPAASRITSTEIAQKVQKTINDYYIPREGVTVSISGEQAEVGTYLPVFILIIAVAVFLVYGVMASQFESFIDPFIIFLSIPLMFIGVVWIYKLTGDTISLFSLIGVVALAGVVVNNGIVLVDYTNTLRARGLGLFEACTEGGRRRLRPILMTTLTTLLGLMPLALFPGKGAKTIQPIAKTMFGGLAVSSIMTLFLTPVLYSLFNERQESMNRKKVKEMEEIRVQEAALAKQGESSDD